LTALDLAIIGAACRLPGGVTDLASYWEVLCSGRAVVTEVPDGRWTKRAFFSPDRHAPGKSYTWAAGVIEDADRFDPGFFGLSPREAAQMDPQQRLALELAAHALDDAGLAMDRLAGSRAGVFLGVSNKDYADIRYGDPAAGDAYFMTGNALSIVANRISWAFDLQGPSLVVDTACSSSLVALVEAAHALAADEAAPIALVGGVNLLLSPYPFIGFSRAGMLSPSGRCRPFDAEGDGYVRAEGGGVIVVKPLARARADGDRIRAVIRAAGTNSDGRTTGLSLPRAATQTALMRDVYGRASLDPERLVYVEAHGTGTAAGDPIEAASIGEALGNKRRAALPIGSSKANLGHLEPASGLAGLIKAMLVLENGTIPPQPGFATLNPAIDFAKLNLEIASGGRSLAELGPQALVGVNSFGFGGANAHAVLSPPPVPRRSASRRATTTLPPLVLTAHSATALASARTAAAADLRRRANEGSYDAAWTRAVHRRHERHRLWIAAGTAAAQAARLDTAATEPRDAGLRHAESVGGRPRIVFVFSGNGSQWAGMGARLLQEDARFARVVGEIDERFEPLAGFSIAEAMRSADAEAIAATEIAQPLLFALQLAETARLCQLGLVPDAILGHSVGEVAAARAAGALSLEDAVAVIHHRSRGQARTRGTGRMLAISMDRTRLEACLQMHAPEIELAGFNSAEDFTLAGPEAALRALSQELQGEARFLRLLDLDYAFHSRAMDEVEAEVRGPLSGLAPVTPVTPLFSTVTGRAVEGGALDAAHWWRNIREPVQFDAAVRAAVEMGPAVVVEIGPKPILTPYVRAIARQLDARVAAVRGLAEDADGALDLAATVGEAFVNGADVDWRRHFQRAGRPTELPSRALDREPFWFAESGRGIDIIHRAGRRELLGFRVSEGADRFERDLDLADLAWLADHRVGDAVVLPAAAFIDIALEAAEAVFGALEPGTALAVDNLQILRPLTLEPSKPARLRVDVQACDGRLVVAVAPAASPNAFAQHATARIERCESRPAARLRPHGRDAATRRMDPAVLYERARAAGLDYGPAFQCLAELALGEGWAEGRLTAAGGTDALLPPAAIDAGFQALLALGPDPDGPVYLPIAFDRVVRWAGGEPATFVGVVETRHRRSIKARLQWVDGRGHVVAEATGCRFRLAPGLGARAVAPDIWRTVLRPRRRRNEPNAGVPSVDLLTSAGRAALDSRALVERRRRFREEVAPLLAAAANAYARDAVAAAFAEWPVGDVDEVAHRLGVAAASRPLLRRLLAMLEEDGQLRRDPGAWRLATDTALPAPALILRSVVADSPEHAVEALLLARAGNALKATLEGRGGDADGTDLTASAMFQHWQWGTPSVDFSRIVLGAALARWVDAWPVDRVLRVLNVSLGDQGFARALARLLPPARRQVVHLALGAEARAQLEPLAFEAAGLRVLEDDPTAADPIDGGDFDLVVAGHALFMTGDDDQMLRRLHGALVPGGSLVLAERQNDRLADLVFAGQPRWLRPVPERALQPRLGHAQHWVAALEAAGFTGVEALEPTAEVEGGESVHVVAQRPVEPLTMRAETAQTKVRRLDAGRLPAAALERVATVASATGLALVPCGGEADERVVWLPPAPRSACADAAAVAAAVRTAVERVTSAGIDGARLWVVLEEDETPTGPLPEDPSMAAVLGALRVLANECGDLTLRIVRLGGFADRAEACAALIAEIAAAEVGEDEVVLRPEARHVPRLVEVGEASEPERPNVDAPAILDMEATGSFARLEWRPATRRAPGDGEVEIRVAATGLNFRDVMLALGVLGDDTVEDGFAGPSLGMECAGIVTAVGPDVVEPAVGDRVVAFARACFATHVTRATTAVAKLPDELGFEAAATVPTVFFSAYYALKHLARLQPGETVLIHGAAGGVGLAAVQVVHALGAEAIVTAGSDEKRDFLRLLGLERVSTSRSLAFVDDVRRFTGGAGVDVVLNSLAGAAIEKSLGLLKPFGRFLELGKRDLYADSPIGLRPFRRNLSYFGIDADQVMAQQPELARKLFAEMLDLMAAGVLRPIPFRTFGASTVAEAFALMQSARHIGKVVVRLDPPPAVAPRAAGPPAFRASADGWHVVTGGLAGFGLETARWLARSGARRLALVSRSGPGAAAAAALDELAAAGVQVDASALDVADEAAVATKLAQLRAEAPIHGVFHLAAVFDDAAWSDMDEGRLTRVLAPKLDGARALDRTTREDRLQQFVVYSSATTLVGNPGQMNYVAANLALESLIQRRRRDGLPGVAVLWGPIADAGYVARNETVKRTLAHRFGGRELTAAAALDALGRLLAAGDDQRVVAHLDWSRVRAAPAIARAARFAELKLAGEGLAVDELAGSLAERLDGLDDAAATALVCEALAQIVANVLKLPVERIIADSPLTDLGLDSLMGVELALLCRDELGIELPASGLGAGATLNGLAERIVAQLRQPAEHDDSAVLASLADRHGATDEVIAVVAAPEGRAEVAAADPKVSLL